MSNFLFSVAAAFLLLAMHPFVTYPISLLIISAFRAPRIERKFAPEHSTTFAICLCAYNEAPVIEDTILSLLELRREDPSLEILVYVDSATDATASIAQKYVPLITLFVGEQRAGKSHGMNLLVSKSKASVIVFCDANVKIDPNALRALETWFADPEVGCVSSKLIYTDNEESPTAAMGSLYWRLEMTIKRLEQRLASAMGADGSCFAVRRVLHRPPPDHIIDDMYVSLMVILQGARCVQADDVLAYEKSIPSAKDEFSRKTRIACQAFNVHRLLSPALHRLTFLLRYMYVSHKLLRWFTGPFLALSILAFTAGIVVAEHYLLAAAFLCASILTIFIGLRYRVPILTPSVEILRAFAATAIGVYRALRGERFQTWNPATSIRK